jgi:hypothetical protein
MALKYKKIVRLSVSLLILSTIIVILTLLKNIRFISEYVFTRGISRAYIYVVGSITSILPLSFLEILALVLAIFLLVFIVRIVKYIRKHRFHNALESLIRVIRIFLVIVLVYVITASFSYFREPLESKLPQYTRKPDREFLVSMTNYYINELHSLYDQLPHSENGDTVMPYDRKELSNRIQKEFLHLNDPYFSSFTPSVKALISSRFMLSFSILGISFQPTGEANYNYLTPNIYLPAVMAHEISHSKGIMRESDANLLAQYITSTSSDPYIRYTSSISNVFICFQLLTLNNLSDDYDLLRLTIKKEIVNEIDRANAILYSETDLFSKIGNFLNDLYLKSSGISSGIDSYNPEINVEIVQILDENNNLVNAYNVIGDFSSEHKLAMALFADAT